MSALGQKQTFAMHKPMSALPPEADMCSATWYVRFVPKADIARRNGCKVGPTVDCTPAASALRLFGKCAEGEKQHNYRT